MKRISMIANRYAALKPSAADMIWMEFSVFQCVSYIVQHKKREEAGRVGAKRVEPSDFQNVFDPIIIHHAEVKRCHEVRDGSWIGLKHQTSWRVIAGR